MNNNSLNINGKLPKGLVELYQKVSEQANKLDIPFGSYRNSNCSDKLA
ncbi:hypothetical protein JQC92_21335 [Shewanella sp. 202IG2-18]|nr:hypothetical protein [Parashewanella hymeniacidonis]MBM7074528.1 hypothetical protein [Parashewanella hymeniacidonis]